MDKQQKIREYLRFSKRDRIGIGVLLLLIALVFFLPAMLPPSPPALPVFHDSDLVFQKRPDPPKSGPGEQELTGENDPAFPNLPAKAPVFFRFNPNTLPESGWLQLGLKPKTARTIRNYLSNGGKFRKPEDLQKVYGLSPALYEQLRPWIDIVTEQKEMQPQEHTGTAQKTVFRERTIPKTDINRADTNAFIALPGIGSKLANRIIAFREKLGGFHAIGQLSEVFGLADSVYRKIEPYLILEDPLVKKIRINEVTFEVLRQHPYFRYELAKAVIAYRNAHGAFKSPEDLKHVMLITEEVFRKIQPYVRCD